MTRHLDCLNIFSSLFLVEVIRLIHATPRKNSQYKLLIKVCEVSDRRSMRMRRCNLDKGENRVDATLEEFKTVIQMVVEVDQLTLSSRNEKPESSLWRSKGSTDEEEEFYKETRRVDDSQTQVAPRKIVTTGGQGSMSGNASQAGLESVQSGSLQPGSSQPGSSQAF